MTNVVRRDKSYASISISRGVYLPLTRTEATPLKLPPALRPYVQLLGLFLGNTNKVFMETTDPVV